MTEAKNTKTHAKKLAVAAMPDVQVETPDDGSNGHAKGPPVLGQLIPDELMKLQQLRMSSEGLVREIGNTEVRKARLLGTLQASENEAQKVLGDVGRRLNIPDGTPWSVTSEGLAILATLPPGAAVPPGVMAEDDQPEG